MKELRAAPVFTAPPPLILIADDFIEWVPSTNSGHMMNHDTRTSDRQVIFVGGTAYSGSTLIDMMLAHGPGGFSCGEVSATFHPYRRKHIHYSPHVGPAVRIPWSRLIPTGPDALYSKIFDELPDVRRIIDSSKDPLWIASRSAALEAQGITVRHVLIWKTPAEFYQSRRKRGRQRNWARSWINYHRYYFQQVHDFASIAYKTLVTEPQALAILCEYLQIPYFSGKHEYWRSNYQTLFGNRSAKRHLFNFSSGDQDHYEQGSDDFDASATGGHHHEEKLREIYYEPAESSRDGSGANPAYDPYLRFLRIAENQLMSRCSGAPDVPKELKASRMSIAFRKVRRSTTSSFIRLVTPAANSA